MSDSRPTQQRDPRLDEDIRWLEDTVRTLYAPFEMAARGLGYADLQQYMQTRGFWWFPSIDGDC